MRFGGTPEYPSLSGLADDRVSDASEEPGVRDPAAPSISCRTVNPGRWGAAGTVLEA